MDTALVIGGTRYVGRHTVLELLDAGYDVAMLNRGEHPNPFDEQVTHVAGDRTNQSAIQRAAAATDADIILDSIAYKPSEVKMVLDTFEDLGAYVCVSSVAAYRQDEIPSREDETPIYDPPDDEVEAGYGERKAGCEHAVFEAAERGINAMVLRPCLIYGPYDYRERLDYWIDRLAEHNRVIVPGDGMNLWHRAYVEDVARALRLIAERGEPGEAYNVGDRRLLTLEDLLTRIAGQLGTDVEIITANDRELATAGLSVSDFPLYVNRPLVYDSNKLADLGWDSTPLDVALQRTVEESLESERTGEEHDPGRRAEEKVLEELSDKSAP